MAAGALTLALAEELERVAAGLKPMGDRIIVLRDPEKEQTSGGIIIADTAKEKSFYGTVVAVGPGRYDSGTLLPMTLEVGDRVVFGFHSGTDLPKDCGERLMVMRESEVWCKR
jgi:chaperonin GroES